VIRRKFNQKYFDYAIITYLDKSKKVSHSLLDVFARHLLTREIFEIHICVDIRQHLILLGRKKRFVSIFIFESTDLNDK
jgi:hypothetical protein